MLPSLKSVEDLDADGRAQHECGGDDLDGYPKIGPDCAHFVN